MTTIHTIAALNPAAANLGEHAPKPTSVAGNQTEATLPVWIGGTEERINTGFWECTPGVFKAERVGYSEICMVISGRVTLETEDGDAVDFGPGDVMVMPSGWKGTWHIHETLRKHYTTIND